MEKVHLNVVKVSAIRVFVWGLKREPVKWNGSRSMQSAQICGGVLNA
jgi:hypothetical protein